MVATLEAPPRKKVTPDDLLQMQDQGKGFELVDGELVELEMSFLSSFVAGEAYAALREHVKPRGLGWTTPEGTSYKCFSDDPEKVRRVDAAFHLLSHMTSERARTEGHCTIVPDLVVEVVSPNDSSNTVNEKRIEWLEAGAQLVWVIHPDHQTVHAYRADGGVDHFKRIDTLHARPVLPEFQIPVADLFRLPSE